jgi:hypothetical protein
MSCRARESGGSICEVRLIAVSLRREGRDVVFEGQPGRDVGMREERSCERYSGHVANTVLGIAGADL